MDHNLIIRFLDDLARFGVGLFNVMEYNVIIRHRTGLAVRHLEVDALCLYLFTGLSLIRCDAFAHRRDVGNTIIVQIGDGQSVEGDSQNSGKHRHY